MLDGGNSLNTRTTESSMRKVKYLMLLEEEIKITKLLVFGENTMARIKNGMLSMKMNMKNGRKKLTVTEVSRKVKYSTLSAD